MMCYTIQYDPEEERRGCMTEFLDKLPEYGFLPRHWNFKYEKFLSIAKAGLKKAFDGWTAVIGGYRISFNHEGT